jgi:alkylation response protein AidB-like acyl-CoA dehydrogenase
LSSFDGTLQPATDAGRRFVSILEGHVSDFRERADQHDATGVFPVENFDDLKKSGGMAAFVPEEIGGLGLESVHDWAVGLERLGRGDGSTAIALNMHLAVSRILAQMWRRARAQGDAPSATRNEGMLRAVAAGDLVICATATEAGTDFLRPLTTARREGDGWVLEGRKLFATLSPVANLFVMNVRVVDSQGDQIGFAFVPAGVPGLEPQDDWDALGMRASGSHSIALRGCRVPAGAVQVAGVWGRWNPGLLMGRTLGNLTLLGVFLGLAERARELAVGSVSSETKAKYERGLAGSAGVQHLLGEIDIDLAAVRAVLSDTARRLDVLLDEEAGRLPSLEVAHGCMRDYQCAKWIVNQKAIRIVSRAMDACGGASYLSGHELSRLYRDVRAGPFMQPFSPTEAREYVGRVALSLYPEG